MKCEYWHVTHLSEGWYNNMTTYTRYIYTRAKKIFFLFIFSMTVHDVILIVYKESCKNESYIWIYWSVAMFDCE